MAQNDDIEIGEAELASPSDVSGMPSGRRLRIAIEALEVNHKFTFRSRMDRQRVYNVVSAVRKKTGRKFVSKQIEPRDEEGKAIVQIVRLPD